MDNRLIKKQNGKTEYYITTLTGYTSITTEVKTRGLILVDDAKVWNPLPVKLSDSDYIFIKQKLPEWLKHHYKISDTMLNELNFINNGQLEKKIKYIFTDFLDEEEDVYLLKLNYNSETFRVYLCKRPIYYNTNNNEKFKTVDDRIEKNKLMYPFEDEMWNSNMYETREEYLEMRTKEEDGYNKYFSNPK